MHLRLQGALQCGLGVLVLLLQLLLLLLLLLRRGRRRRRPVGPGQPLLRRHRRSGSRGGGGRRRRFSRLPLPAHGCWFRRQHHVRNLMNRAAINPEIV